MTKLLFSSAFVLLFLFNPQPDPSPGVDAYWAEVSRTVSEGDFEGFASLYHEDAVLVNGVSGESYPISKALDGWKQGFEDTRDGKMAASVEFRFSKRVHGETTAHDTGIFCYTSQMQGEEPQPRYIHFQGLLIKKDGEWIMTMSIRFPPQQKRNGKHWSRVCRSTLSG